MIISFKYLLIYKIHFHRFFFSNNLINQLSSIALNKTPYYIPLSYFPNKHKARAITVHVTADSGATPKG